MENLKQDAPSPTIPLMLLAFIVPPCPTLYPLIPPESALVGHMARVPGCKVLRLPARPEHAPEPHEYESRWPVTGGEEVLRAPVAMDSEIAVRAAHLTLTNTIGRLIDDESPR